MKFSYGRNELQDRKRAQSYCYLACNALGGYASASITQSLTRNDHALMMAAIHAPDLRYHMISKVEECITIEGVCYTLSSQDYVDYSKNETGERYLVNVTQEYVIKWHYLVEGIEIIKTLVMEHGKNTVGLRYEVIPNGNRRITLSVTPCFQFIEKGTRLKENQSFDVSSHKIESNGQVLYIDSSKAQAEIYPIVYVNDVYYEDDARDGRFAYGAYAKAVTYHYHITQHDEVDIIFHMEEHTKKIEDLIQQEIQRQKVLIKSSSAKSDVTKALVCAADQFITKQETHDSLTLMAGYPFFTDWGRDTMYAIEGCCIATKRFDETKDILRTFVKYLHKGLLPNTFPNGNQKPLYNTVDASLLFFQACKAYADCSKDSSFIEEMYPYMEQIIYSYQKGTDYDIYMDTDGLIQAGSGLHQLTWMDIRYDDILPTPRHGKPVEVNAFWYNALCTISEFGHLLGKDVTSYEQQAMQTKTSFQNKFWNESRHCLKDVVSGNAYDTQIRCNQIWAVSTPYSPLNNEQAKSVVETVFTLLYTPYGLRTLERDDVEFVGEYSGCLKKRDLSYHQGTVWPFPLGSYYRAYLKVHAYSEEAKDRVRRQLSYIEDCLREGCIGQIAEIYDGLDPAQSRGCFAQGWSVGELLKVMLELEM